MNNKKTVPAPDARFGVSRRQFLETLGMGGLAVGLGMWQQPASAFFKPGNLLCIKPGGDSKEIYGPTDIGATLGNQRLSVAVNPRGGLSVLRWPSPSYYEQLKYSTSDRDRERLGLFPNEGAFSGLALELGDGSEKTVWLRELTIKQRYASDDSDTVLTQFESQEDGFTVEITDVVPPDADVLLRRHALLLHRDSGVENARLITVANLNPTASKGTLPLSAWCTERGGTDTARYDSDADAIVYSVDRIDRSTRKQRSVAVAIGASRPSIGHQIGADHYAGLLNGLLKPLLPQSAYDDAADGQLSGHDRYGPSEVDAALALPIDEHPVTVVFAAARESRKATELLERYSQADVLEEARSKRRDYRRWLRDAPLPEGAPPVVTRLAKRALISLRQATDEQAGRDGKQVAIVASLATQSPYYVDWIRDGAFLNEALDEIGHPDLVARHNVFYTQVQKKRRDGAPRGSAASICLQRPPSGNWFMSYYADGTDGGIIPWEIDETGYGLWTLYRHYENETRKGRAAQARAYLETVYPAIRRTAEFLLVFRDPRTKLTPGSACEDDVIQSSLQPTTMHASGPVLLAMRSAEAAAQELGRNDDSERYAQRRQELEQAIDTQYNVDGGAWADGFGDGGWALWPVRVKRNYNHPRMIAQAESTWKAVAPSFQAPDGPRRKGQYECKALLGLAHHYRATAPEKLERVKQGLEWVADVQASYLDTGILGESWRIRDGRVMTYVAQPHVWEQVLFYLAAIEAYGRAPFQQDDDITI